MLLVKLLSQPQTHPFVHCLVTQTTILPCQWGPWLVLPMEALRGQTSYWLLLVSSSYQHNPGNSFSSWQWQFLLVDSGLQVVCIPSTRDIAPTQGCHTVHPHPLPEIWLLTPLDPSSEFWRHLRSSGATSTVSPFNSPASILCPSSPRHDNHVLKLLTAVIS